MTKNAHCRPELSTRRLKSVYILHKNAAHFSHINTLRLTYKNIPVNFVEENNRCLVWYTKRARTHTHAHTHTHTYIHTYLYIHFWKVTSGGINKECLFYRVSNHGSSITQDQHLLGRSTTHTVHGNTIKGTLCFKGFTWTSVHRLSTVGRLWHLSKCNRTIGTTCWMSVGSEVGYIQWQQIIAAWSERIMKCTFAYGYNTSCVLHTANDKF
jgi:hypothetical protein